MSQALLSDGIMDSGLGRTLSSYGRPKIRSRSEERMSTMPMMPLISMRSEALSEPIARVHSYHRMRYVNNCTKEDSVLMDVPLPRAKIFPMHNVGQCGSRNACEDIERQKAAMERHKPRREKSAEKQNAEKNEAATRLQVSPLNSNRLQPTRHRTKNAILTILDNGEVCIEFIKRRNGAVCKEYIYIN